MNTDAFEYLQRTAPGLEVQHVIDGDGRYWLLRLDSHLERVPDPIGADEDQLRDAIDKGLHRLAARVLDDLGLPTITQHAEYQQRIDELEQLLVQARGSHGADVIIRPHGEWAGTVHRVVAAAAEADRSGRVRRTILSGIVGGITGAAVTNVLVYVLGAWIA